MRLPALFKTRHARKPNGPSEQRCRPGLESLEDRSTPALLASQSPLGLPLLDGGSPGDMDNEVEQLLARAAAATASNDAIIAIVDRAGNILGVRVEGQVSPTITSNPDLLAFAVDGAVAKARTAAFFANDTAPLTSRTVQFISQTTISEREVKSNPNINDASSTLRGPGFVAPIGVHGHFPPGVPFTPQVDLFAIEHTNRDSILHPGPDHRKGTADDIPLPSRFNVDLADIPPGQQMNPPLAYGEAILSAADRLNPALNHFQSRGIATLPGGIPLYEWGVLVGGIGVFFPGETGYATEENSSLDVTFNPARPDRTLEAEFIALAAQGGSSALGLRVGALGGVGPVPGFDLPGGRIDLVGITLDVVGPGGDAGPRFLVDHATRNLGVGQGNATSGMNLPVNSLGDRFLNGTAVPEGWLVTPHDGVGIIAADVERIIMQAVDEANQVRAQIRLPNDERTRMVFAVADSTGEVLGLFRMPDATVFSIDVAVAKARNTAYYNDPALLQDADQLPGLAEGVAFTSRTFRYLGLPFYPEGIQNQPPGPFSHLNDPGIDPATARQAGPALPASAYSSNTTSVVGFDAFNPGTNFRALTSFANQNGIVFFPGSSGVYKNGGLVGGFGVSGDGVDQDDVVTAAGIAGYGADPSIRADQFFFRGVRLPYFKFPRNPLG
jgi:uncharacterized protein GlcG (DUF336 family)